MQRIILAAIIAVGLSAPAEAASGSPEAATKAFYDAYLVQHVRGIPDASARAHFTPLISPALDKLLADADAAEKEHFERTKNQEPPLVEGDAFSSLFEGATSYKLGECSVKAATATCDVHLSYAEDKDAKPTGWVDQAVLAKRGEGWVLDDIVFGATWDFGNHGRMQDLLRQVPKDANP
ncbi:MAG: hypothetical protein P4L72_00180 [Parvibaculum sp.]|uniref:hypothetical protein n=1 Tax=Parvibaculum sp. TaxID=2024848 RepID=UPI002841AAB0|nr:hypothetical protein [Parvibaculum sp.]MDR3497622.1 hypothetical protein [Parvibaculum sp.]